MRLVQKCPLFCLFISGSGLPAMHAQILYTALEQTQRAAIRVFMEGREPSGPSLDEPRVSPQLPSVEDAYLGLRP